MRIECASSNLNCQVSLVPAGLFLLFTTRTIAPHVFSPFFKVTFIDIKSKIFSTSHILDTKPVSTVVSLISGRISLNLGWFLSPMSL